MKRTVTAALLAAALLLPGQAARADDPGCAAGEEWQGEFGCVAVQLPEEANGRAIDCPDGTVGYMQDGRVECPAPPLASAPTPAPVELVPAAPVGPVVSVPTPAAPAPAAAPAVTFDAVSFLQDLLARLFGGWLFR